jgi:ABC-type branched-subunit amino acid transport system ATPase component
MSAKLCNMLAPAPTPVLLSVEALNHGFHGAPVLKGIDLVLQQGRITGVIGPNGAGKTTLFNVVSGLYRPVSGKVVLDGIDITNFSPQKRVAAGLVRTFQLARGFPKLTVFQHLMLYGQNQPGEHFVPAILMTRAARVREAELAERAHTIARRLKLSHVLDNPVTALSGGQKKLLEIGRALMTDPRLILLDEPMAGVNPTLAGEIAEHLSSINADGVSIALIEHDMGLVRQLCDPVIVLANGRRLSEGSFEAMASDHDVQEAYLGRRHVA